MFAIQNTNETTIKRIEFFVSVRRHRVNIHNWRCVTTYPRANISHRAIFSLVPFRQCAGNVYQVLIKNELEGESRNQKVSAFVNYWKAFSVLETSKCIN